MTHAGGLFSSLNIEEQPAAMSLFFFITEAFQESFVFCSIDVVINLNGRILHAPQIFHVIVFLGFGGSSP